MAVASVDITGGLRTDTGMVPASWPLALQALLRSARLPLWWPPHLAGDGAAAPTTSQLIIAAQVTLTTNREFGVA